MLQKMREGGQPLVTSTIQLVVRGMKKSLALEIICDALGVFKVTRDWIRQFLKQYMNLTFKVGMTIKKKLPND
jgi:hypothetical protein